MPSNDLRSSVLRGLAGPVVVVSSKAGLGNFVVGAELARRIATEHAVEHVPIEQLISDRRVRSDFDRHRWLCVNAPWLLHAINGVPLSYRLKLLKESLVDSPDARVLEDRIASYGAKTVIAVNNRAAFWLGALKRRGRLDASLWGFVTDYGLSMGWRHQFWPEIDRILGPVPPDELPEAARSKYERVTMPVREGFTQMAARPGDVDQVLLTGGGWGLGRLAEISAEIATALPRVLLHVVCGDNRRLWTTMNALAERFPRIRAYGSVDAIDEVLARCAAIITKPGAITLAEGHAARRRIFLIAGLPGVEEKNRRFAMSHMGAEPYSLAGFSRWARQASERPRDLTA